MVGVRTYLLEAVDLPDDSDVVSIGCWTVGRELLFSELLPELGE
ncbi:hypothetical protein [Halalkalicoccus subterraneus]|nr:hypothetical protein [Halalkalicoccus subterraneus]